MTAYTYGSSGCTGCGGGGGGNLTSLTDENGNVLWHSDNIFGTGFYISQANEGTVVERPCGEGGCRRNITFYDMQNPRGVVVTPTVDEESRLANSYLSEDGKYFAVKYYAWKKPDEVVLFDVANKKQLWVKQFESDTVRDISVSAKGSFVSLMTYNGTSRESLVSIFNSQGYLVLSQKPEHIGNLSFDFDNDEKYFVAASNSGELYMFDLELKKLLWKYYTGDENIGFLGVDVSTGFIASSITTINPNDNSDGSLPRYLYVFDYKGNLLSSRKFTGHGLDRWGKGLDVEFKDSARKIRATINERLYEFENEFATGSVNQNAIMIHIGM